VIRAAGRTRKEQGIDVLIEKLITGRPAEVRPSSWKELSKTMHPLG